MRKFKELRKIFLDKGHQWEERTVRLADATVLHRQCRRCLRNFVLWETEAGWRAVHVGALQFIPVDELTNALWLTERCPGMA